MKRFIVLAAFASLLIAPAALAQGTQPAPDSPFNSTQDVIDFIRRTATLISGIFWIIAIIMTFYAAFLYLTAAGSEDRIKKAKKQILYVVIAIIIGLMAGGLPTLIESFLSGR